MAAIRYKSMPLWAIYAIVGFIVLFFIWYIHSSRTDAPVQTQAEYKPTKRNFNVKRIVQQKDPVFDYRKEVEAMNAEKTAMDDVRLVDLIRNYFIQVPPDDDTYNLEEPTNLRFSRGQTSYVDQRLHAKEHLFYVEVRAFSGEAESTTLFFEKTRYWSGLLVEPDPVKFDILKSKHRKAYLLNACINDKAYPTKMTLSRPDGSDISKPGTETYSAQCFPLYSVLLALGQNHVSLLSLNLYEFGSENLSDQDMLMSLPFDKINVTFIGIRNMYTNKVRQGPLEWAMEQKGFESQGRLQTDDQWISDFIYLNKDAKLPQTPFWTKTNIIRAVILFLIIYGILNVLAYRFLFPRLHLYKVAYGLV
ncbi:uncharacterized protein LOC132543157 [Ylistrum balloti]|uniref:uncharacterized protein LOC132543157 n=1 Tax=Ylistrum balloti TaxID=509963 RepID=UPI002905DAE9|nr:uncharacterized protein LOC132543157 [Ylistrum balloti]